MYRHGIVLVVLMSTSVIPCVLHATPGALDAFQTTEREETPETLLEFMRSIFPLQDHTRKKLLQARLLNARIDFDWEGGITSNPVQMGKQQWTLSRGNDGGGVFDDDRRRMEFRIIVLVTPNSAMKEFMRAADEYAEISHDVLNDENLLLHLSGKITSSTWKDREVLVSDVLRRRVIELTLPLASYKVGAMVYLGCHFKGCPTSMGSVNEVTDALKQRTAEFVQFYMGRRAKPENFPR